MRKGLNGVMTYSFFAVGFGSAFFVVKSEKRYVWLIKKFKN